MPTPNSSAATARAWPMVPSSGVSCSVVSKSNCAGSQSWRKRSTGTSRSCFFTACFLLAAISSTLSIDLSITQAACQRR